MAATVAAPGQAVAYWAWPAAAALILIVLLAPFLIVDVPAVLDYPNHLARIYILAHANDPVLARMYAPHWSVLPNIGTDLLGEALLRVLPVHLAGRMLLALSLVAPLAGTVVYARAAFGRWTWWSLGAGVIGFNGIFFMGFMNCLVSVGLALAGAAAWRVLRRRAGRAPAVLAGAVIGLGVFFCHLLGFAFFALLIGAQEAERLLALRREDRLDWRRVIRTAVMLLAVVGPTLALFILTHHRAQKDVLYWNWGDKAVASLTPFVIYDLWLTTVTAVLVIALMGICVRRRAQPASGVCAALVTLAILFVAAPTLIADGSHLDARLAMMAGFLVFAGLNPQTSLRDACVIAAVLIAVGLGRTAEVAVKWQGRARDLAELRTALAPIGPGSRVLLATTDIPHWSPDVGGRRLQGYNRVDVHMAALAVIERRAFWPLLFADPTQQPVAVRPPYDQMAQGTFPQAPRWPDLVKVPFDSGALRGFPYLRDWRRRFDYLLVLGPPPSSQHRPPGLSLIRAGGEASLYRIDR